MPYIPYYMDDAIEKKVRHIDHITEYFSKSAITMLKNGDIVIQLDAIDKLPQATQNRVLCIFEKTMYPESVNSKYCKLITRIRTVLNALGDVPTPEDLLVGWYNHMNRLRFSGDTFSLDILKFQASAYEWGLNDLKAITALWIQTVVPHQ